MLFYYFLENLKHLKPFLFAVIKIALISIPINIWWVVPMLNYYLLSPQTINSQITAASLSWTQARASFLNLFWLNGIWGWLQAYVPYINAYSNPILIILVFVPFLVAGAALLFKKRRSFFNYYLMIVVLFFMFLAKGLHEPLSQLNSLVYKYIPYMNIFSEPTSKFEMLMVVFLALLIGCGADYLSNLKVSKIKRKFTKIVIPSVLIVVFVVTTFPLVTNPIAAYTNQSQFSPYVKIPDYWYQAANWLNSQNGSSSVLITPLDDYYQMGYTWGYYGTDQLVESLIQKPIISTDWLTGYGSNSEKTVDFQQLETSVEENNTVEFKAFLDLFNVKYILQRDDVVWNLTGRQIMSPDEMQDFLSQQPYLHLVEEFGQLKVYEYMDSKPALYVVSPQMLQNYNISIENIVAIDNTFIVNPESQSATILNYQIVNPTKIVVTINARQPFILATSQTLDKSWIAYVNGDKTQPVPLYLGFKGFAVNSTGIINITIEYPPQTWFYYSFAIFLITVTLCFSYLILTYPPVKQLLNHRKKASRNKPIEEKDVSRCPKK